MGMTIRDNYPLGAAGLAEGTNANTFQHTNILHYVINGRAYRKAAADNIAFTAFSGTTFSAIAALRACCFFFWIDAAGTITVEQSTTVTSPRVSGGQAAVWEWPEKENHCCIGAMTIRTDGSATFTAGSTDLGATDVVDVFVHSVDFAAPVRMTEAGATV